MTPTEAAKEIVEEIVEDFTHRRGLRQEWEGIEKSIQVEIEDTWRKIAVKYCKLIR